MNCNFYDILQVEKYSGIDSIKKSFRKLAMIYHPDKQSGDKNKFQEINEAYRILSNNKTKEQYDELLKKYHQGTTYKNKDYHYTMNITIEESLFGIDKVFYYKENNETKGIPIKIPSGIPNNKKIKFIGYGESTNNTIKHGDLIITIVIIEDDSIKISNINDVTIKLQIDYILATTGGIKYIDGLYKGSVLKIDIPECSRNGDILTINNEGIFDNYGNRGKLYCIINLYPPKLSSKKIEALKYINEYVEPEIMVYQVCKNTNTN